MPEDLLSGVLSGEDEQPESEAPQAMAGAEAFAAAIAAIASRQDPGVARETEAFLREQTRLLDTQRRHLEEEHVSRLTQLHLAVAAAKRKRFTDYLRNSLYTGIALLVLGLLVAVARMTAEAMSDHGLVVQNFTVQSDLAASGVTSPALAEDLASRLAAIRDTANSHSLTYSGEVRADQADALKVEIPETGISLDELERFLHRWLGHQTLVNGELREQASGQISVVLHITGAEPIEVNGSNADVDRVMQAAAERTFAVFDPTNTVLYLTASGRRVEAYDSAVSHAHAASRPDAIAYALLADFDPDRHRALSNALIATDIDPRVLVGWAAAERASANLGHDEAAVNYAYRWIGTRRQDQLPSQRDAYPWLIPQGRIEIDELTGDFAELGNDYEGYGRGSVALNERYADRARVSALLHDEDAAQHELTLALAAGPPDIPVLQARWDVSSAAGQWAQALDSAKALVSEEAAQKSAALTAAPQRPEFAIPAELALATRYRPLLALAEAMTGDTASATALISQTPTDCYLCVRMRARIAAASGDTATADHWFAEAVRQAPDLPLAYYEWGQALVARGDLVGTTRELSLAHEKGPHFADALKAWGDVLVKQGHPEQALKKYDEALKYAPNWAALKQARDAAGKPRA